MTLPSPFWSVMIPTYNRPEYLSHTIEAVLAQDPSASKMQIEVIDDCSNLGDPAKIVADIAAGRVAFHRNPKNLGIAQTWNTCVGRARGKWIHILHDDDLPLPGFYQKIEEFISSHPEVGLVFCRAIAINGKGKAMFTMYSPAGADSVNVGVIEAPCHDLILGNYLVTPAVVVRRDLFDKVGMFNPSLSHCADWEMWMRIGAVSSFGYLGEPLLHYRQHSGSDTSRGHRELLHLKERLRCIDLCLECIDPPLRKERRLAARRATAHGCNFSRKSMHNSGLHSAAVKYAWAALTLHPTARNALRWCQSLLRRIVG